MPQIEGAPAELNKILEAAYASALKKYPGNKTKASKIAYGAAANAGWSKDKDGKWAKKKKEMKEEIEIDAFKEGDYPQGKFGAKELSEIQETYNPENYEAPILIGHLSDPSYKGKSAIPAFGWIGKVKVVGDHLKLVASQFSDELKEFIKKGLYKKVSAAFYDPKDETNPTPGKWHLHHLAFLGGVPPAVKGLEGIQFSAVGVPIEMAEMDTEVTVDGDVIDTVEEMGAEDTINDLTESCATFISKIQDTLASGTDYDTIKSRCSLAASDLSSEVYNTLNMHWTFQEKLENIEEHKEGEVELSEKKSFKAVLIELAEKFIHNKPKEPDMDAQEKAAYEKTIADQKVKIQEFTDAKVAADKIAGEAADKVLRAEIHSFCETNKFNTNKHKEMKIEEVLFASAKANQVIEFSGKDKDGKDIKESKPLLVVLQDTLKTFQFSTPSVGEITDFNTPLKHEKTGTDARLEAAEKYVKDHPAEFSELPRQVQKVAKALRMESNQQISFTQSKE